MDNSIKKPPRLPHALLSSELWSQQVFELEEQCVELRCRQPDGVNRRNGGWGLGTRGWGFQGRRLVSNPQALTPNPCLLGRSLQALDQSTHVGSRFPFGNQANHAIHPEMQQIQDWTSKRQSPPRDPAQQRLFRLAERLNLQQADRASCSLQGVHLAEGCLQDRLGFRRRKFALQLLEIRRDALKVLLCLHAEDRQEPRLDVVVALSHCLNQPPARCALPIADCGMRNGFGRAAYPLRPAFRPLPSAFPVAPQPPCSPAYCILLTAYWFPRSGCHPG